MSDTAIQSGDTTEFNMTSTYLSEAKERKTKMKAERKAAAAERRLQRRLTTERENEAIATEVQLEVERRAAATAGVPFYYDVERMVDAEWDLFVSRQVKPCLCHRLGIRRYRSLIYCDCTPDGQCEGMTKRSQLFRVLEGR